MASGTGEPTPQRRAARVVLLDPDNQVLLMRYDQGPPNGPHWATPGGTAPHQLRRRRRRTATSAWQR